MTLLEAVRGKILSDSTLSSTLDSVQPITGDLVTKDPWCTIRRISGMSTISHSGGGLTAVRVEVTIYSSDVALAERLIKLVRDLFKGFNGLLGGSVKFSCGAFAGPRDVFYVEARMPGQQLDILGLVDEDTIS